MKPTSKGDSKKRIVSESAPTLSKAEVLEAMKNSPLDPQYTWEDLKKITREE